MTKIKPKMITVREGKFYNLTINKDFNDIDENGVFFGDIAVLTFTPNTKEFEHYHIDLEIKQVKKLKKWVDEFLELYS